MKELIRPIAAVVISAGLLAAAVASARHQQQAARAVAEQVAAYGAVSLEGTPAEQNAADDDETEA